ncbi:MAG: acyl-CoA dehydrogenase family protein [Bryobacterales bacterium]|nr:acyl-CoA dehydrogenase family protein [Bryobacterales bacterium]
MASSTISPTKPKGGSFLIESTTPEQLFSPEDFTEEHRAIARTTEEFWANEIAPNVDRIQHQEPGVAVAVLRKAGELGLTSVHLPEKYGGMEMDLTSAVLVAEGIAKDGSYATWHGGQSGIGALPLLLFGTEEQKQRYLPRVASAELIAAYALSEPQAGSDALAARTRADLSADGKHYMLNGQKMWITNGGAADLYTIFAKIDGEKFTAFLVERQFPGVAPGAEEKKMGIKGSSTTAIYLDNVPVPVENVLGEIGRGHIIAFNILNIGRLKLGAFACGGAKEVLRVSLNYAKERKAFGKSISEFGLIQHKLAEMAIRIFATESATYRVVGLIEGQLEGFSWDQPSAAQTELKAVEEFAAECSYIKIFASEMLDYVTDEAVQIHGGYGYHQDYIVERAYRDSRINRIFEGTNEINRLLATGMLLKRAQRGLLPLVEAVKKLQAEILAGPTLESNGNENARLVENAKKTALFALGVAYQTFGASLEDQQEVLASITDIAMNAFVMESVYLRSQKLPAAADICAVFLREAMEVIDSAARNVLAASSDGDALRMNLRVLKRFTRFEPVNAIAARRRIAERLVAAGRYAV